MASSRHLAADLVRNRSRHGLRWPPRKVRRPLRRAVWREVLENLIRPQGPVLIGVAMACLRRSASARARAPQARAPCPAQRAREGLTNGLLSARAPGGSPRRLASIMRRSRAYQGSSRARSRVRVRSLCYDAANKGARCRRRPACQHAGNSSGTGHRKVDSGSADFYSRAEQDRKHPRFAAEIRAQSCSAASRGCARHSGGGTHPSGWVGRDRSRCRALSIMGVAG